MQQQRDSRLGGDTCTNKNQGESMHVQKRKKEHKTPRSWSSGVPLQGGQPPGTVAFENVCEIQLKVQVRAPQTRNHTTWRGNFQVIITIVESRKASSSGLSNPKSPSVPVKAELSKRSKRCPSQLTRQTSTTTLQLMSAKANGKGRFPFSTVKEIPTDLEDEDQSKIAGETPTHWADSRDSLVAHSGLRPGQALP